MTTQTKSNPLLKLITIAVILFIAALIWKNTKVNNEEIINIKPVKNQKIDNQKFKERTIHSEKDNTIPTEKTTEIIEDEVKNFYTDEEKKVYRNKVKSSINNALMFKTPESIMEVIINFQSKGDDEKANEYIELLLKKFPDYDMDS